MTRSAQRTARIEHGPKQSLTCGPARYSRHGGLHVLHLAGGPYDMGFQHGTLLREAIERGPLLLYEGYLRLFLGNSRMGGLSEALTHLAERTLTPRIIRNMSPWARAAYAGLADGSGLPEDVVLRAAAMPETLLGVLSHFARLTRRPTAVAPFFGCSSAIAGPKRTVRGQLLHGRNFDFFGMDRWAGEALVAFHAPEEGHEYVGVTSAGVLGGGITAMNAKGVTLAAHQHFARTMDFTHGRPVGEVGDEVMRMADSVDEAISVLDTHKPISAWTYILSDPERAVAYEVAPGIRRVIEMTDGVLGYANVFQSPDLHDMEVELYTPYVRANHARHDRLQTLLSAEEKHSEEGIINILADRFDARLGRDAAFGQTIATPNTAASVIFRPADRRLWVSAGGPPAVDGPYIGFDLKQRGASGKPKRFNGPLRRDDPRRQAIEAYVEGTCAVIEEADYPVARASLERAVGLQRDEPLYRLVAALLAIRAGGAEEAAAHAQAGLDVGDKPEVEARLHLAMAWALDLQKQRKAAKASYRHALSEDRDADLRKLARSGLRRRMTARRAAKIEVEFIYAGVV